MNDSLNLYRKKRDFKKSSEPAGKLGSKKGFSYLIQKHEASHLHYDFRLELNGVLKSWAVPKGPSYDPADKRLAMQVEDHPVAYGTFEGTIPAGQYGGGTVMLWDTGTWKPVGDPVDGLKKGKLVFQLRGKRLKGEWTLVRTFGKDGSTNKWLLIKHKDEFIKSGGGDRFLEKNTTSIVSQRSMAAIAKSADKVWQSNRQDKNAADTVAAGVKTKQPKGRTEHNLPKFSPPQLATLTSAMPKGKDWVHEIKFDGYRIIAHLEQGKVKLFSRNGHDWSDKFSSIADLLSSLSVNTAILDGEVVVSDPDGRSNFSALKDAITAGDMSHMQYYVFDLLFYDGKDMRSQPLSDRKKLLEQMLAKSANKATKQRIIYSEHFSDQGDKFLQSACSLHLEGVMSKRLDASYVSGRSKLWLKTKCHLRQEFVIGGFTLSSVNGPGIGSLLLGYYDGKQLIYAGRVGTGFNLETSNKLRKLLEKLRVTEKAYQTVPAEGKRGAIWVKPQLVAEVEFSEWTPDHHLRHPSFQGLREDKNPRDIVREIPEALKVAVSEAEQEIATVAMSSKDVAGKTKGKDVPKPVASYKDPTAEIRSKGTKVPVSGVSVSHPDRIIYPGTDITKLQLAEYYAAVARHALPYIKNRPISVMRCPEGIGQECFFQRHLGLGSSPHVHEVDVSVKREDRTYMTIDDEQGLISLIQWGVIELHPWQCSAKKLDKPDQMVFDLDPDPGVPFKSLVDAAREVRARLEQVGLTSFLKTTGGKGLHLVVPIAPLHDFKTIKSFAHAIALSMEHDKPSLYLSTMSKAARKGKIFIDYLRNDITATAVAPFSARARTGATVSTPIAWNELRPSLKLTDFTILTVPARLKKLKTDPWHDFHGLRQKIAKQFLDAASEDIG